MQIRLVPQRGAFCNFDESIELYGTHWIRRVIKHSEPYRKYIVSTYQHRCRHDIFQ